MEDKVTLEFFHDPLCAWCYAMSPRVRRLVVDFPQLEVAHRGFALAPDPSAIEKIFGDKARGRREILDHWRAANENDDGHRMKPDLMADQPFDYPWSLPPLLGCEAARQQGGDAAYWDYFDEIQKLHLTECRNIVDAEVLADCGTRVGLDSNLLMAAIADPAIQTLVEQDMARAHVFGLRGVPALVLDGQLVAQGALSWTELASNTQQVLGLL
jgi:putative protein-disulfide isomerase